MIENVSYYVDEKRTLTSRIKIDPESNLHRGRHSSCLIMKEAKELFLCVLLLWK